MTDSVIKQSLIDRFLTLNTTSGTDFIMFDTSGNTTNVALSNKSFTPPDNGSWFELYFLPAEPVPASLGENAQNRWTGIFQIDICVPLNAGDGEVNDKYSYITELFKRGTTFDDVEIQNCYSPKDGEAEDICYRKIVRITWTADIDN